MTFAHTHTRTHMKAALLLLTIAGSAASAQLLPVVVSPQIRASEEGVEWRECSVAVRSDNKFELMVMGSGITPSEKFLGYTTILYDSLMPGPQAYMERLEGCGSGDVWVTADSSNGKIWFVTLSGAGSGGGTWGDLASYEDDETVETVWYSSIECTGSLNIGWKEPSPPPPADPVTVINDVYTHSNDVQDKPSLAIGGDLTTKYYLLRQKKLGNCSAHQQEVGRATMPTDGASAWTDSTLEADPGQPGCHYEGWGAAPVVLDASLASDGRVVAVVRDAKASSGGKYNLSLPYVVYSDDGIDWKPDPSGGIVEPIKIGDSSIEASTTQNGWANPGDTPWNVDRRLHAPSIAVRYIEGLDDEIYVAFCAREALSSTNTDIYISRSTESQTNMIEFPVEPENFFQVSDTFLGTPTGTDGADQFVPAIAVDSCGGVNLMFYDNRHDPDRTDSIELVDVYYARITNYGTPGAESVYQKRLTPQSIRVDNLGLQFLGDYHNLTVSADGRTIYAAYISRDNADPVTGDRTCYVHRIGISCIGPLAEMTGDGTVSTADATAFTSAWSAGEAAADTNLDMVVNAADLVDYLITYAEEAE